MSRQALGDILSFKYAKDDHEFVRYFNCFGTLVDVYCDARKAGDFSLSRDALLILQNLFLDGGEGHENIAYFIRSGGLTQLAVAIMEDYRVHRTKTENAHLILPLTVIGICLEDVLGKFASNLKLNVVKDQLFNELEALGVDDFCVTVLKQSVHEAGTEVAYSALCILKLFASVYVKRKSEHRITHVQKLTGAPFAFCQSTFTKEYLTNNCKLGSARICVVFCAFRLLNILARCHIGCFQGLFHDTPKNVDKESLLQINRTELLHMFSIFFPTWKKIWKSWKLFPRWN
ncbi:hypothetical protein AGDE_12087 [Angomonas deanei]|uniref:Uncharacterized protein n=1 Tax=Angomonas deanei TaxID=59799 RepID=A0A7G2CP21_9TRYP|nr:hypothetical protein AGDE_12087 [Angomonas deanei]CAD2220293.1 hypothetical protein, conserved [Angomonas deanei]|eukprot:EPY24957.1 hypothetical protein AGDE_12087 [Angomonas deanei]